MSKEQFFRELQEGHHLDSELGNTDSYEQLEQLNVDDFAKLELMSWMSSGDDDVLRNQAPFHVVGSQELLPRR